SNLRIDAQRLTHSAHCFFDECARRWERAEEEGAEEGSIDGAIELECLAFHDESARETLLFFQPQMLHDRFAHFVRRVAVAFAFFLIVEEIRELRGGGETGDDRARGECEDALALL